ncbi:MAG: ComEC/Rec2 family competence protein, partial [Deltaproteobacteria bacterium]|nr:ComEC/Rec2 family competence protein [Deltaproteobacteria bacterium]
FFSQWNILAFVYNFILVPTFGVALVGGSVLFYMSLFFPFEFMYESFAQVQIWITEWFLWVIEATAKIKIGLVDVSDMSLGMIVMVYASLIITYLYLQNQSKKEKA